MRSSRLISEKQLFIERSSPKRLACHEIQKYTPEKKHINTNSLRGERDLNDHEQTY